MELIHLLNEMFGFVVNFEWHFLTSSRLLVWSCASSAFRFSAFFDPLWSLQFFVCVLFYVSLYLYRKCWLQRRVQVERAASIKENCQFVLFNSFIVTANGDLWASCNFCVIFHVISQHIPVCGILAINWLCLCLYLRSSTNKRLKYLPKVLTFQKPEAI